MLSSILACLLQVRDAGNLLTRAGFALPGVDVDEYVVRYKNGKNFPLTFFDFELTCTVVIAV